MKQYKTESKFGGVYPFSNRQLFFAKIWIKLQKAKWFYFLPFQFTIYSVTNTISREEKKEKKSLYKSVWWSAKTHTQKQQIFTSM